MIALERISVPSFGDLIIVNYLKNDRRRFMAIIFCLSIFMERLYWYIN